MSEFQLTLREGTPTVAGFGIDVVLRKEMEAREKLRETLYFLKQIKELEQEGRTRTFSEREFRERNLVLRANLSAFVLAWDSIPGIILYDFAEKFGLPFTRNDRMMHFDFALAALDNPDRDDALELLAWLVKETKELRKKHDKLAGMRDVVTHRGIILTERGEQMVETDMPVNTTAVSGIISWYPGLTAGSIPGQVTEAGVRPLVPVKDAYVKEPYVYGVMKPLTLTTEEGKRSFTRFRGDTVPITDRCESGYNDMKSLVDEAWRRTSPSE